jgi:cytochrome c-type biogenesis protein CcmE
MENLPPQNKDRLSEITVLLFVLATAILLILQQTSQVLEFLP